MNPALFIAQRLTAFLLALAVVVHLTTILYAIRGGLSAGEILARTHGNVAFMLFYSVFVISVAIHAPIGLRNVIREWTAWKSRSLDAALSLFSIALLVLGFRAVFAVYTA